MSVSAYSLRARHHRSRNDGSERYNNFIRIPREKEWKRTKIRKNYKSVILSGLTVMMASGRIPGRLMRREKTRK